MSGVPDDPELLLAERGWLRSLAAQLVRRDEVADELAQDAMAAAVTQGLPRQAGARGWLAAILRRQLAGRRRAEHRRLARERVAAQPEAQPATIDTVARFEVQRAVADAVLALPEPYRTAVLLRFWDDLSPKAIAQQTQVPVETVRTRLKRGLVQLRQRLDTVHGGDRRAWALPLWTMRPVGSAASSTPTGVLLMPPIQKLIAIGMVVAATLLLVVAMPWPLFGEGGPPSTQVRPAPVQAPTVVAAGASVPSAGAERVVVPTDQFQRLIVMSEDGTRLSEATVHMCGDNAVFRSGDDQLVGSGDANGEVELPANLRDLLAEGKALVVGRDGYQPRVLRRGDVRPRMEIKLLPAEKLLLQFVREADGSPVAGVRVALSTFGDLALLYHAINDRSVVGVGAHPRVRVHVGQSDGGGAVRIDGLPPGRYRWRAQHPTLAILHGEHSHFVAIEVPSPSLEWKLTEPYVCVLDLGDELSVDVGMGGLESAFDRPPGMGPPPVLANPRKYAQSRQQIDLGRRYRNPAYRVFTGVVVAAHRPLREPFAHKVHFGSPSRGRHQLKVDLLPASRFKEPLTVDVTSWPEAEGLGSVQIGRLGGPEGWNMWSMLSIDLDGGRWDVPIQFGADVRLPPGEYRLTASMFRTVFSDAGLDRRRFQVAAGQMTEIPWVAPFPLMPCRIRIDPPSGLPAADLTLAVDMLEPVVDPEPASRVHVLDYPGPYWLPPGKVRISGDAEHYEPVSVELRVRADAEGVQELVVPVRFAKK